VHSLKEVITFNEQNKGKEMPYFGQDRFIKAEAKGPLTDKEYLDALEKCRRLSRTEGIDAVMDKHKLDALVAPSDGPAWLTDLVDGDHSLASSTTAAAVCRLSQHYRAGRFHPRFAGGNLLLRASLERANLNQTRIWPSNKRPRHESRLDS